MLRCNKRGVVSGYPLRIEPTNVEVCEVDFDPDFVVSMLPKLQWGAFVDAVAQLGIEPPLPAEMTEEKLVSASLAAAPRAVPCRPMQCK